MFKFKKDTQTENQILEAIKESNSTLLSSLLNTKKIDLNKTQSKQKQTALMWASTRTDEAIITTLIEKGAKPDIQDNDDNTALIWAIRQKGHLPIVKALIEAKADLNLQNQHGNTALRFAASQGHLPIVKALIEAKANLNLQNQHGNTALIWAAYYGNLKIVEALIQAGANLDLRDNKHKNTALIWPAQQGHLEIVEATIAASTDLNLQTQHESTALIYAAQQGHLPIVKALIEANADLNLQDKDGHTALMWAIKKGYLPVAQRLITAGADADLDLQDKDGSTAILWAAYRGHAEIVQELIQAKANINLPTFVGNSSLMWAIRQNHTASAILLIDAGANLDLRDKKGNTALLCAANKGYLQIVEALIAKGPHAEHLNLRDQDENTALIVSTKKDHLKVAERLITAGADLDLRDKKGNTALLCAANKGYLQIVEALIAKGPHAEHLNLRDQDENTALIVSIKKGHLKVAERLITAGADADLDLQDKDGNLALMWAIKEGYLPIAQRLITAGANLNLQSQDGDTTLQWAEKNGHLKVIVQKLIQANADINLATVAGNPLLIWAILQKDTATAIVLIDAGADLDLQDKKGNTALMWAIKKGYLPIAQRLITAGADVNLKNHFKETPLIAVLKSNLLDRKLHNTQITQCHALISALINQGAWISSLSGFQTCRKVYTSYDTYHKMYRLDDTWGLLCVVRRHRLLGQEIANMIVDMIVRADKREAFLKIETEPIISGGHFYAEDAHDTALQQHMPLPSYDLSIKKQHIHTRFSHPRSLIRYIGIPAICLLIIKPLIGMALAHVTFSTAFLMPWFGSPIQLVVSVLTGSVLMACLSGFLYQRHRAQSAYLNAAQSIQKASGAQRKAWKDSSYSCTVLVPPSGPTFQIFHTNEQGEKTCIASAAVKKLHPSILNNLSWMLPLPEPEETNYVRQGVVKLTQTDEKTWPKNKILAKPFSTQERTYAAWTPVTKEMIDSVPSTTSEEGQKRKDLIMVLCESAVTERTEFVRAKTHAPLKIHNDKAWRQLPPSVKTVLMRAIAPFYFNRQSEVPIHIGDSALNQIQGNQQSIQEDSAASANQSKVEAFSNIAVLFIILGRLPEPSLLSLKLTCKGFNDIIRTPKPLPPKALEAMKSQAAQKEGAALRIDRP